MILIKRSGRRETAILLIAPILPKLQDHYGAVPNIAILAPVLMTVPALCVALFSPLAGLLSDRVGRRKLLFGALALRAPLGVAPLFIEDIWAVLATRVGVGIAEAVVMTVSTAVIGDYFEGREREKWLAWQVACSSISAVVLLLGAGLLGSLNWKAPFAAYALSLVLLAVSVPLIWEPARRTTVVTRVAEVAFPTRIMAGICAITVLASVIFYIVPVQMGFILGEQGITATAVVGAIAALGAVAVPLGSLAYHRLSSLRVSLLAGGFGLAGLGLLVVSVTHTLLPTLGGVIVNQLGCGLLLPALLAWAMVLLPPALRGRGVGVWMGSFFVGQFVSPVSAEATVWLISVRRAVENLTHASPPETMAILAGRAVTLPALRVRMADLVQAIAAALDADPASVTYEPDAPLEAAFGALPRLTADQAARAGFHHDGSLRDLIAAVL